MINPYLKQALQSRLSDLFPIGKEVEFIRTVGFKAEPVDETPIKGVVERIEHPWVVIKANDKEYKVYEREIN